jgi:hypothetical protein
MQLELERIADALREAWENGSPVASPPWDDLAMIALRRWKSSSNRGLRPGDLEGRIRDLTKGLITARERDPELLGPLERDYEYLARTIARHLSATAG